MIKLKQRQKERKQLTEKKQRVIQSDEHGCLIRYVDWKTIKFIEAR